MGIYGLINLPRHLTTNKTPLEVTSDSKQLSQYYKEEDEEVESLLSVEVETLFFERTARRAAECRWRKESSCMK